MAKYENADSSAQCEAEMFLFNEFRKELQLDNLSYNAIVTLDSEVTIKPDVYSGDHKIIGEIHSHLGKLKPAQKHKVAADILKMLLNDKVKGKEFKKYIIVCSEEEQKQLLNEKSHLGFTRKKFGIEVRYYPLTPELKEKLKNTMKKQDMYGKGNENG
ncbi:hypothetical protein [Ruminococcus flavefaciens]|uniref:Uncharacterized protein n=1 Tax=Ruminococcus flavefaciens TaxID=1265 RepID=A0A1M7MT95_RUMFL|nr:hypothetical protein [Ruminococcus flavefaciens]SHM94190.1 hypothetical protein SAMN04487860_1296 [Ruminococcus flavefaciens]